ncbi:MAG: DUF364 domain-containing protein [Deltaproteobacteria bacterium]|jgi:uncharacterized protein (DUF4213/DUF364 family)|nr:DUF364 domain-containing protein [Deltaproteobacteria bacterium]
MEQLFKSKWDFYDLLLDLVPLEAKVKNCTRGPHWVAVESDQGGMGLAHCLPQSWPSTAPDGQSLAGKPLKEAAELVKSWDFVTASMGLAAVNAAANQRLMLRPDFSAGEKSPAGCAFDFFLDKVRGRKVAVVGHFPNLEKIAAACSLTILERNPQPGDLPDPAAEYILPEQGAVFLTGTTIINKTLPRLLELSQGADIFLVGPSTPMFPELFRYGLTSLSGTLVQSYPAMAQAVSEGLSEEIFQHGGLMINLLKEGCQ